MKITMPDIDALRGEYRFGCAYAYGNATCVHTQQNEVVVDDNGIVTSPGVCTILTDGQCPRPTAPREIDVRILAAVRAHTDAVYAHGREFTTVTLLAMDAAQKELVRLVKEDAARRQQAALTAENDATAREITARGNPALRGKP